MKDLIKIDVNENQEPIVNGRELYEALEIKTPYTQWFDRMKEYGFVENTDFCTVSQKCEIANGGYQEKINHAMKLDMAKEIAMIQRNERGKEVRQYFIQVEKDFNSPEKVMARALKIAENNLNVLKLENKQQQELIEEQKPKVLFAEAVTVSKNSISVGKLATVLKQKGVKIGRTRLFEWLRKNNYLCQQGIEYNKPTQKSMDMKLLEYSETTITHNGGETTTRFTPYITGKGQIYFVNKFKKMMEA